MRFTLRLRCIHWPPSHSRVCALACSSMLSAHAQLTRPVPPSSTQPLPRLLTLSPSALSRCLSFTVASPLSCRLLPASRGWRYTIDRQLFRPPLPAFPSTVRPPWPTAVASRVPVSRPATTVVCMATGSLLVLNPLGRSPRKYSSMLWPHLAPMCLLYLASSLLSCCTWSAC